MYVDYGYYADQYGGGITEKEFPSAERKAEAYIRKLTYIRGNIFATEDMAVIMYRSIDLRTIKDKDERKRIKKIQEVVALKKRNRRKMTDYEIGDMFA